LNAIKYCILWKIAISLNTRHERKTCHQCSHCLLLVSQIASTYIRFERIIENVRSVLLTAVPSLTMNSIISINIWLSIDSHIYDNWMETKKIKINKFKSNDCYHSTESSGVNWFVICCLNLWILDRTIRKCLRM